MVKNKQSEVQQILSLGIVQCERIRMSEKPAVLGGKPAFKETTPIVRPPSRATIERTLPDFRQILKSGIITNFKQCTAAA